MDITLTPVENTCRPTLSALELITKKSIHESIPRKYVDHLSNELQGKFGHVLEDTKTPVKSDLTSF